MIIPSIDLMEGKAVQLRQGKEKVLERNDVLKLAKEFSKYGELAVIDLDSALGKGDNLSLIKEICGNFDCRVGGGIRTVDKAIDLLRCGAKKIIIGTMARPEFLKKLPKDKVIVAIDTKCGCVVNKGWTESTKKTPSEMVIELQQYCSEFLFTNVDKEGLMQGLDFKIVKKLQSLTKNKITVAGGITSISDIKKLERLGLNSQVGMAVYTGKINLSDAFLSVLKFNNNGLIPTIAQDINGQVLMMAYSTKESLANTLKKGKASYYSRSRKKLWVKGETSGNYQQFVSARYDCDRDTLLFTVKQKNCACHTSTYSCFGDKEFSLTELYEIIKDRLDNPKEGSYTSKILKDEKLILNKIKEEAGEVVNYRDQDNLIWEIADLTYFMLAIMVKKGITIDEIKNELRCRRK